MKKTIKTEAIFKLEMTSSITVFVYSKNRMSKTRFMEWSKRAGKERRQEKYGKNKIYKP